MTAPPAPRPIVLVHGAWHGGWCWARVAAPLRAAGHAVYTPTLTGLGERAHLLRRDTGLETHVQDILGVLECEELTDVVLVGHSYGGMVITAVADRAPRRLHHLVYLDALVPRDGESLVELTSGPARAAAARASAGSAPWLVPPILASQLGVTDQRDAIWLERRLTPHPLKSLVDAVRVSDRRLAGLRRTFIHCTEKPINPDSVSARRARETPGWTFHELATGHDAMMTAPQAVADLILAAAGGAAAPS